MWKFLLPFALLMALLSPAQAQTNCLVPASFPGTPVVSASAEAAHVLKAAPGCLIATYVVTGAASGYLMVLNATSKPIDGAVTPIHCVPVAANSSQFINFAPQPPEWYSTGITVIFSTTGCFTKTESATAFFHGLVQ